MHSDLPLTARQHEVLRVIHRLTLERGLPPTIREVMPEVGIGSTNGLVAHLDALHRRGLLASEPCNNGGKRLACRLAGLGPALGDDEAGYRLALALGLPVLTAEAWDADCERMRLAKGMS